MDGAISRKWSRINGYHTYVVVGVLSTFGFVWSCDSSANEATTNQSIKTNAGAGGSAGTPRVGAPGAGGSGDARSNAGAAPVAATAGASAPIAGAGAISGNNAVKGTAGTGLPQAGAAKACEGKLAGEMVCDNAILIKCGANGVIENQDACDNEKLCQAGLPTAKCAACEPGTFHCEDDKLKTCDATGQLDVGIDCVKEICDETTGKCNGQCQANEFACDKDSGDLKVCSEDRTEFEVLKTCEKPELCDSLGGKCNECVPNSTGCEEQSIMTCSADGKKALTDCKDPTSYCNSGKCVACIDDSSCKNTDECKVATCNSGTCSVSNAPASTPCTKGGSICNGNGSCVQCTLTDSSACKSNQQCNMLTSKCESMSAIQVSVALGSYSVVLSPDYTLGITITKPTAGSIGTPITVTSLTGPFGITSECSILSPSDTSCKVGDGYEESTTLTITGSPFGQGYTCVSSSILPTNTAVTINFDQDSNANVCEVTVKLTPTKKGK
jgi:hypothetical protein